MKTPSPEGGAAVDADASEPTPPIYLDHNATTPLRPEVADAMAPWLGVAWGNPSSGHLFGRQARAAVEAARAKVAACIGARAEEIVFTSGGTESDNWAILGLGPARARLLTSSFEHPAVEAAAVELLRRGGRWRRLPSLSTGQVDLAATELEEPQDLISVILAHNETGAVQPIGALVDRARAVRAEVIVHSDGAQAVGKMPVDVRALGVDALTIAGHKLNAPKGIGALFLREGLPIRPLLFGGGQEGGRRPGTEPVAQIVGLGAACELASNELTLRMQRCVELREDLWDRLFAGRPGLHRTIPPDLPCLPNTLHLCVPGLGGPEVLAAAPQVAASNGSACHGGGEDGMNVLSAMGLELDLARGALRLSVGPELDGDDIELAADALLEAMRRVASAQ